jgi:hypothetical protein
MISGVPRALKRFIRAMQLWISAVCRSGSSALIRLPKDFRPRIRCPAVGCAAINERVRLDPAAGVVSGPAFPERPPVVSRCAQGVVGDACSWAAFFRKTSVLSERDDRNGVAFDDGIVAAACVLGAVGGDRAYQVVPLDLAEQIGPHGAVAVGAGGEFHLSDVGCGRVHGQMDLAPLASALHLVLASLPFAIAEEFDPGAVDQQVQRAIFAAIRDLDGQGLLPAAQRGKVRHGPSPGRPVAAGWPPSRRSGAMAT